MQSTRWPLERAGDALAQLAEVVGLSPRTVEHGRPGDDLQGWLVEAARWLGVEVVTVAAPIADVAQLIAGSAPALVRAGDELVAVVSTRGARAVVLRPDGGREHVAIEDLAASVAANVLAPARERATRDVASLSLSEARARRAVDALVNARTRNHTVSGVYALRMAAGASLRRHARAERLWPRFAAVAGAHATSYVCGLAGWFAIGTGALGGRIDGGWLVAWALIVFTAIAVRFLGTWWMGNLAIDAGALLKRYLLVGAVRADLDKLRADGVGQSLGRVFEAAAVERLAIGGGFLALFASIELVVAAVVLGFGAGGLVHVVLLFAALAATVLAVRRYIARRRGWTERRLGVTHDLVEAMAGHATRLAQQPVADRHVAEDRALLAYNTQGAAMDRTLVALQVLVPRGWLVLAAAVLAPIIVAGGASPRGLAAALGGVLLAYQALGKLANGVAQLGGAAIAWDSIEPLVAAAAREPLVAPPGMTLSASSASTPAVTLRGVMYRPARRPDAVLAGCDLTIERGEHVLLEGASGAGKSTLAAIIAGVRAPDGGLVLAGSLDRASLGASGWRRRVACAPQFHENHLFTAPLAFNLLVGRAWPPTAADLGEATAVCKELGLGELLERMPSGLFEMVGETGWQLSHGERSRVYLARALLQRAPLVVLDESLAALDPSTLQIAIACIERRTTAALVVAHP